MAETKVSFKLLIDTQSHRVLFAEAGKDFVDFLFNILTLPVGTVVSLLTKANMVGCLGNLYDSIETMNMTYMQPNTNKDSLLNPKPTTQVRLLLPEAESPPAREFYTCSRASRNSPFSSTSSCSGLYVADYETAVCPNCRNPMTERMKYVARPSEKECFNSGEGGYVKDVVTYMVMDDLVVKPMSTISSITLLNKFNVKDVGTLEEEVIHLGFDEGVKLLKASLHSKTVLSDLFLGKDHFRGKDRE